MAGSKMVVLVPDAPTRDRVRAVAAAHPIAGLSASVLVSDELVDVCVRDTRRALFDGPLVALTRDEPSSLRALAAGADEAYAVDALVLDGAAWERLVARARIKNDARRETCDRLAALSELEKLCALGRLVSGVAEELSDPVTSALLALDALSAELEPLYAGMARIRHLCAAERPVASSELRAIVEPVRLGASTPARARDVLHEIAETCRAIALVARDLGLREHAQERHEFLDLRVTLDRILDLFRRAAPKSIHIERIYAEDVPEVFAPRARVAQVLISLLANALASVHEVERDVHRLRISLRADDAVVTVSISDTGPGLAPEVLARIFEPGAASETAALQHGTAGGVGLELAVARATARALGGDLMIESLRGEGTTFVAWLPRPKERQVRNSEIVPARVQLPDTRHSVLVLDPDRQVLGALSRLLGERYDVLLAWRSEDARKLIASGTRPEAILAAADEPEGHAFVEWLLLERPELARRVLLTTANVEPREELSSLPCLEKPLEPATLFREIEERLVAPLRKTRALEPAPRSASRG